MKKLLFSLIAVFITESSHARTWTSSDGKKMEAELVRSDGRSVTIKRAVDGQVFTVPLTKFSKEDQDFVTAKIEEMKAAEAEKNAPQLEFGDFASMIKGEWVKGEHKKVPIWNFHGDRDADVPVQGSRDMVEALEKVRAPIKYTEMKGEGHGIPGKVYQQEEVHAWLFAQKRE